MIENFDDEISPEIPIESLSVNLMEKIALIEEVNTSLKDFDDN